MHPIQKVLTIALASPLLALPLVAPAQAADDYPNKPITLVVPFPAGGGADTVTRGIARGMSDRLGVTVIVENKGGAGTVIGTQHVIQSEPDGYTLLVASTPTAINPTLRDDLPYDTLKDLTMVSFLGQQPLILNVNPASDVKSVKDLVKKAKANPGKLTYGSSGVGGSPHLATSLFLDQAGITAIHAPYKGSAPAVSDLIGNQTSFVFDTTILTLPFIKSGKLLALAQTSDTRSPLLPDVPTLAESGFPGFKITSWYGIMAPSKTPESVIKKLSEAINDTLKDPKITEPYTSQGFVMTPADYKESEERFKQEVKTWGEAVKISGAKVN